MIGPFEMLATFYFIADDGRVATAQYEFPVGTNPTREELDTASDLAVDKLTASAPGEWRLMTRHEFENQILNDRTGGLIGEFATKEEWDT